ncbi:MAG: dTDP-4-dehydrorhamnose reductase [Solirubrobacterales bacterium]
MTSFAIVGANGQLGTDLVLAIGAAGHDAIPLTHAEIEVTDRASVDGALDAVGAQIVINTAAFNVEASQLDPERAFALNADGARRVAEAAAERGMRVMHIGTDYVFDGAKGSPYLETDATGPLNVYGETKLAGEQMVLEASADHVVVRTSGLYGVAGCRAKNGMNFVTTMLKLADERDELTVVDDEVMTPTYTADLARQIVAIADNGVGGVVHATSGDSCSWFEFTSAIIELSGAEVALSPTTSAAFNANAATPIDRPHYSVLQNARLAELGIDSMRDWREALAAYLAAIGRAA